MNLRGELKPLLLLSGVFLLFYFAPVSGPLVANAFNEALALLQWYAREHVILCLLPALLIAGAIAVFISQAAVMQYLGPRARRSVAYSVASVSGAILAVCSCTVLPLFAGIYKRGAGLGPATAFLYSGPAINVLAVILTARVLGWQLGVARAVGAIVFAVAIGLAMHWLFRKEEDQKSTAALNLPQPETGRPILRTGLFFAVMIALLVFATWGDPGAASGLYASVFRVKWLLTAITAVALAWLLAEWFGIAWRRLALAVAPVILLALLVPGQPLLAFSAGLIGLAIVLGKSPGEGREWLEQSWGLAKQILPLLFAGVLVAGFLLGGVGGRGIIPPEWVASMVGGNSFGANLFASVAGALMYFATLTEVPILQGLLSGGMGQGPALALLLAGPALSLPNMLVIASIMGWNKTAAYSGLVVALSTICGWLYGSFIV